MAYEERRVVTTDPVDTVEPVATATPVVERVRTEPAVVAEPTVVEQRPARTYVSEDPVANVFAATQLIQTIVWSVVVIVLLAVALVALHAYAHLF